VTTHHHLHCVQCGKVIDFYSRIYDNLKVPKKVREEFRVMSKRVVLKGVCKRCSNLHRQSISKQTEIRKK
jgi:Fur family peroxide stress response transcriptional regulator